MTNKIKTICVFCGSRPGTIPQFEETAIALAGEMLSHKVSLILIIITILSLNIHNK